jgi:arginyl-tRNA--protein-N-Asp/Glu arginylyltransferase
MNQQHPEQPSRPSLENLAFYASAPHDCGYLPGRSSVTLFADPEVMMDRLDYSSLVEMGFRRSGPYVYKPHCPHCQACLPARIPVEDFLPNRTQQRTWRRNTRVGAEISTHIMEPGMREEQFALYRKYISIRHAGGGMDDPNPDRYLEFLANSWAETEFVEFRLKERLIGVAVMDVLERGLSSIYTFFDPDLAALSPGRHALLWQINETRRRRLPCLYLGYWIKDCQKMLYKQEYRPLELYLNGHWQRFERHQQLPATAFI